MRLSVLPGLIAMLLNVVVVGPLGSAPDRTLALEGTAVNASDGNLAADRGSDTQRGTETDRCTDSGRKNADNSDRSSIIVECPGLNILKRQVDAQGQATTGPINAGDTARFEIVAWNLGPGTALDVIVEDSLPVGVSWSIDAPDGVDCASSVGSDGQQSFSCSLGDVPLLEFVDAISILVFGETDRDDCGELLNMATVDGSNNDDDVPSADATITVRCPTIEIDKVADTEVIAISGSGDAPVATPSVVTWTLTYTLANGPVTNAVITDEVPVGFGFLDASDGGQLVDGVVTWTFPTLTESGSVTFRTTVDPETISRADPTVNVAVVDSDETEPDSGEDSVRVTVEPPPLGGTPTPEPSLPNTASAVGPIGEPVSVPIELLAIVFLGSAGGMALANARARSGRR